MKKKLRAIYTMLENEIVDTVEWWKDNALVAELDKRYAAWVSGKEKGYSIDEMTDTINELRKKRSAK